MILVCRLPCVRTMFVSWADTRNLNCLTYIPPVFFLLSLSCPSYVRTRYPSSLRALPLPRFWRSLFFFATQGERRLGLLKSFSPAKVTTSLANEALLPYLAGQAELHEEADGQGIGGDVNDDEDQHSVVDEEIEYDD